MEMTIAEAINLRLKLGTEQGILTPIVDEKNLFEEERDRMSVDDELDEVTLSGPKVELEAMRRRNNKLRENIRLLDSAIQQANFTNKVKVKAFALKDFEDAEGMSHTDMEEVLISDVLSRRKTALEDLKSTPYFDRADFRWEVVKRIKKADGLDEAMKGKETTELKELTAPWSHIMESYIALNNCLQKANWDTSITVNLTI